MKNTVLSTKKAISLLLALIMAVSMIPSFEMAAYAEELSSGSCGENVTYSFDSKSGTLTISGTGDMYNYISPNPVSPFRRNQKLTNIIVQSGVPSIGGWAFEGCSNLTSITIPNTVTSIGEYAFFMCKRLTDVTIPNSVMSIGLAAFNECLSLTSITIPSGVTRINNYTFSNCSRLTSVTIPSSVTSIGDYAFSYCSGLRSITIPNSVTSIDGYAFYDCSGLTSITIPNGVTSIGNFAFDGCSGLTSVTIPSGVTSIGIYTFSLCSSLTSVTIPISVTSIGAHAFYSCSSLTSVTIPSSVTSIGAYAFYSCSSMTRIDVDSNNGAYCSVDGVLYNKSKTEIIKFPANNGITNYELPNTVENIGNEAFDSCKKLTSITIPSSVTSVGDSAFARCLGLARINVDSDNEKYCSVDGVLYNKSKTKIIKFPANNGITNYELPDTVENIGNATFADCSSLTNITIPSSVTSIGDYAFVDCSGLTSVTIPSSVTSMGYFVFDVCSSLNIVNFGGSKQQWNSLDASIAPAQTTSGLVYVKCSDGTIVYYDHSRYIVKDDVVYSEDGKTLVKYPEEKTDASFTIPDTVVTITDDAFENTYLKEVIISENVMKIGKNAFSKCPNLATVKFADGSQLTTINEGAFKDTSIESVTLPANLTYIGTEAFNTKNLTYVDALGAENIKFESNCFGNNNPYLLFKENSATSSSAKGVSTKKICFTVVDQVYTGDPAKPTVVIVIDGKTLQEGTDYVVTYDNKTDIGAGKIVVTGKGKYKDVIKSSTVKYHIFKITAVKLSKYSFTYNGKVRKPTVTNVIINDGKGNKTLTKKYYKVTFTKGCKKVGTYNAKVTLRNGYSGNKTVKFKINPDNATKMSLSSGKKKLTVKWKTAKQASGYQLQYSTSKNFKNAKKVNVKGAKKTGKTIKKLKKGTKYYVRIRTYKIVKGKTYYSSWSKAKTVKTK